MSARHRTRSEREQLKLFRALPVNLAPRAMCKDGQ